MPVRPTYPGIYIEELPSAAHTITAAPTSIAVFIGYTHPFKTRRFNEAVQVFSFTEYEREFGGLYKSSALQSDVAYAVQQFFLNGGAVAYVIGLKAEYHDPNDPMKPGQPFPQPRVDIPDATATPRITFLALEPTDAMTPMTVTIANVQASDASSRAKDTADILISYGSRTEAIRRVKIDEIVARVASGSKLVTASVEGESAQMSYPDKGGVYNLVGQSEPPIDPTWTTFFAGDFVDVFRDDGALDKIDVFNIMVLPGVVDFGIWARALAFAERKRAFLIMDPPPNASADGAVGGLPMITTILESGVPQSANGAMYFPYLESLDPLTGKPIRLPPSGAVAGIYARTDNNRGVWKAPAGLEATLNNVLGVVPEGRLTDMRAGNLNENKPVAINAIRTFRDAGTVVFGARTIVGNMTAFEQWRYVPVRRMALFLEQTFYGNLGWAVFEPNDERLWVALRTSVERFMLSLFRQGAFQGTTPSEAFLVKCDSSTTTQDDIDLGRVNLLVGFRPLKPAEFVVIQITQLAGQVHV